MTWIIPENKAKQGKLIQLFGEGRNLQLPQGLSHSSCGPAMNQSSQSSRVAAPSETASNNTSAEHNESHQRPPHLLSTPTKALRDAVISRAKSVGLQVLPLGMGADGTHLLIEHFSVWWRRAAASCDSAFPTSKRSFKHCTGTATLSTASCSSWVTMSLSLSSSTTNKAKKLSRKCSARLA